MCINDEYINLLEDVLKYGNNVTTRGNSTRSNLLLDPIQLETFPLVTIRKTAWKKAIREMEWFMSGKSICPDELLDWWEGQLNPNRQLVDGYAAQLRSSTSTNAYGVLTSFDQVAFILEGLKNNPNSRRLIMTTWNPGEMANITKVNDNPQTPTCCHGTMTQFFVRNNTLNMKHYQRSADLLLGVPHNWVQYWALLLYFAHHAGLNPGWIRWDFGDAHIYNEPSHMNTAREIAYGHDDVDFETDDCELVYKCSGELDNFGTPKFKASDFKVIGEIPKPLVTLKPKLIA